MNILLLGRRLLNWGRFLCSRDQLLLSWGWLLLFWQLESEGEIKEHLADVDEVDS